MVFFMFSYVWLVVIADDTGAAKGQRSLASSDRVVLSFQMRTYTPGSNNLKKKKMFVYKGMALFKM